MAWFIFGFIYSSNYFAGEIKTGRRTQFYAIPGAVAAVVLLLLITIPFFQHMVGRDFINQLGTADPAAYGFGAGGAPAYPEIAAIGSGSPILGFIIIVGFVGGIVAWLPMTMMLASRCFLAWSFDRVMPEMLSDVDERTHSPILAVDRGRAGDPQHRGLRVHQLVTTLTVLFPETLTLLVVAVAGAVLPYCRRQLYQSSARARKVAGLPLLTLVGIIAFIGFAIAEFILLIDPGSGTSISDNPGSF